VAIARPGNEATTSGAFALWVRDLALTEPRVLSPVDGDAFPFWSPDGRWLGFFTNGKLNKIEVQGGPVVPLTDASDGRGGSWNEDGIILFQRGFSEGLMRVSAAGGTPESVTILDKERVDVAHRWPHFLPDGRHFIFYVVNTTNPIASEHSGLYVGSLDSTETRLLLRGESRALYAREHLLYRVGTTLMAHAFDASNQELTGEPVPLAHGVAGGVVSWGGAQFGAAADVLVHTRGAEAANSLLNWRNREGEILSALRDDTASFWEPRISHDQTRVAVCVGRAAGDIWIYDLERGGRTRFTFHASDDRTPVWSPDDSRIAFSSTREALGEIWVRPSSGQGDAELLYTAHAQIEMTDWSSDGRFLFFKRTDPNDASSSVWAFDLESSEAAPVVAGTWVEDARLSPDGKWLAYVSDESGRQDVYVRAFPEAAGRWMISNDSGAGQAHLPAWRGDGQELFYLRGSTLLAVSVAKEATFSFGTPSPLLTLTATSTAAAFDVSEDGQRILANELSPADFSDVGATLIQNWTAALER
jgi:Tol biopolymer transport system component